MRRMFAIRRWGSAAAASAFLILTLSVGSLAASDPPPDRQSVVLVVGAEGTAEYGAEFGRWAVRWREVAGKADAKLIHIGPAAASGESSNEDSGNSDSGKNNDETQGGDGAADKQLLRESLTAESSSSKDALWLVLIGHGTSDGRTAKFNLRGEDVSAAELAEWLQSYPRPLVVVNCASSSGPFLNALSGPNRVIITATKSGQERNYARFGDYFSSAIAAPESDLDKDGQTSVLEAFLSAARRVTEFYEQESRLATEHALIDDTGDKLGTPADWFQGVRATKRAQNATEVDGRRARQIALLRSDTEKSLTAEQRQRRDALELELDRIRELKSSLEEAVYFERLEKLLLELARIYEQQ